MVLSYNIYSANEVSLNVQVCIVSMCVHVYIVSKRKCIQHTLSFGFKTESKQTIFYFFRNMIVVKFAYIALHRFRLKE